MYVHVVGVVDGLCFVIHVHVCILCTQCRVWYSEILHNYGRLTHRILCLHGWRLYACAQSAFCVVTTTVSDDDVSWCMLFCTVRCMHVCVAFGESAGGEPVSGRRQWRPAVTTRRHEHITACQPHAQQGYTLLAPPVYISDSMYICVLSNTASLHSLATQHPM